MSDNKTTVKSGGIGFVGLLTIVFVVLKLTNYIDWSWWWIFSPLWISTIASIALIALAFIVYVIILAIQEALK